MSQPEKDDESQPVGMQDIIAVSCAGSIYARLEDLVDLMRKLSAADLQALLERRQADDKALRILWRAVMEREKKERRNGRGK